MKSPRNDKYFYENIAAEMVKLIEQGTYRPGDRLPSVRQLSRQQDASVSTVLQAYLMLENRGLVEARPQSGYYVRLPQGGSLPEPDISTPGQDPTAVNLHDLYMMLMRDAYNPSLAQLGSANPDPDLLPIARINRILSAVAREAGPDIYEYDLPPGRADLRAQIARRAVLAGCQLSPNDIVITQGGTEALHLSLYATCSPGDIVAIESPMFFGTLQLLEVHGLRALEIPTNPREGISLGALQFAIEHNPIRAVLSHTNFSNPLGSLYPDEKKRDLIHLLERYDIPLIDNDVLSEFYFTEKRPTAIKAFDRKGLVLQCSSFSKDIGPSMRVGWIVPGRYMDKIEWLSFTIRTGVSRFPQVAIARFLESGGYEHIMRRARRAYADNMNMLTRAVTRAFPPGTRITRPSGGMVMWVELPEKVDSLELYALALKNNITLAPGHLFSPTNQFPNFIRLNASGFNFPRERAVYRLAELVNELAA